MNLEDARAVLLQHSRSKRNGLFPGCFQYENKITNPICGDQVHIRARVKDHVIAEIGFSAKGCAICSASTSLMCEFVEGQTPWSAIEVSYLFEKSILEPASVSWPQILVSFQSFEHLRVNPSRRSCAVLPWVALRAALK